MKDKEEFQTLKQKIVNVLAAVEKSILENNEYKTQQTRLDEDSRGLLSELSNAMPEIAEVRSENERLRFDNE